MRIVISNSSIGWGGVDVVNEMLAVGLKERGHEVVVFCRPGSMTYERIHRTFACEPIVRGMDLNPRALAACYRALGRHQPDVVLTLLDKDVRITGPAAWLRRIPVIVSRANNRPLPRGPHARILYGMLPVHHIANSNATRETILRSAPWLDAGNVTRIYNGIDVERFAGGTVLDLGLPDGALVIGFLGRFYREKGVLDLASAWPSVAVEVPNAHLVIAGGGPLEAQLRTELAGASRVHWLGYQQDVPALMRAFGIVVIPSHTEAFGLVAAEAMAAGVPVVASAVGGLEEVVRDGVEGRLVPPRDPDTLARAIVELAKRPEQRERMAHAGRERMRHHFGVRQMIDETEGLIRRVVASAGERAGG